MKIRNGFVSNSSSSSFIISDKNFASVRQLTVYMINKQIQEYADEIGDVLLLKEPNSPKEISWNERTQKEISWSEKAIESRKEFIKRLENIDEDHPISFPSCNYDTYIRKIGDCFLVATCNNTEWDLYDYSSKITDSAKDTLKELLKNYSEQSDDYRTILGLIEEDYYSDGYFVFGKDFYDLNKQIIGIETYDNCANTDMVKHDYEETHLWDTLQFGKICLKCSPLPKRKDKLNNINKLTENE